MANAPIINPNVAPSNVRRFRTNPVELAIFSVVSLIFCHSVYNLFYDNSGFQPTALSPMAANPVSEGRSPASASQAFVNFDVNCNEAQEQTTAASKVRLTGSLCGSKAGDEFKGLAHTSIVNTSNKFAATVFTDTNTKKFSTDYIPLSVGSNSIHLEFTYLDGQVATQDIQVLKQ